MNSPIYSTLSEVIQRIDEAKQTDTALQEPLEMLQNAQIQIQESADLLRRYHESVEHDPERLEWVNKRLSSFHELARKHQTTPNNLYEKWQSLHSDLSSLSGDDYDLDALQARLTCSEGEYLKAAEKLSKTRIKAAKLLSAGVSTEMQQLGMNGGEFCIQINRNDSFGQYGLDDIEFTVSANPGQPLKALKKVASGGELSRISLAIQMIAAQKITLPALIFDEVDSGIGGGIAEVVGKQLRKLGESRQVLCVTHLPQVASCAHNHHKVLKMKGKKHTNTGMLALEKEKRVEEIARMMGGIDITQKTLNLAEEMLAH